MMQNQQSPTSLFVTDSGPSRQTVTVANSNVYGSYAQMPNRVTSVNQGHSNEQNDAQSTADSSDTDSVKSSVERLIDSLNDTMKKGQLPKLELSVFKGDPLEFQQWMTSFEKLIEELTADPARRLHYLLQYTAGSANTLVSGFVLDQTA